jgi:hypothetical protein
MNKYYMKLGSIAGSSRDALHFGWSIVEKFVLNFDRRGSVVSSPHLRPSDVPRSDFRNSNFVIDVTSETELAAILARLKHDGKLPVVIDFVFEWVSWKESYATPRDLMVTIDDYDPATGEISIENQWGSGRWTDRRARLADVARAPRGGSF